MQALQPSAQTIQEASIGIDYASIQCPVPPEFVKAYMLTPQYFDQWCLGCMKLQPSVNDTFRGESSFNGGVGYLKMFPSNENFNISYLIGGDPFLLNRLIVAQIVPDHSFDNKGGSVISLVAWRNTDMDDDRWNQLKQCHQVEIQLIRNHLVQLLSETQQYEACA